MFGSVHDAHAPFIEFSIWAGVGKSTVYRWADGADPIPKWVALLLTHGAYFCPLIEINDADVDWLPFSDGANGRHRPATTLPDGSANRYDGTTHDERIAPLPLTQYAQGLVERDHTDNSGQHRGEFLATQGYTS